MESLVEDKTFETIDNSGLKVSGTAEEFQNFITKLFEKNGVLHDLRASLRGHIITVLKSIENGELPYFQKHITQRLESKYQALNVVISEYLMKMEFSYSLSVFISEIPLANMVFDFTKLLLDNHDNILKFSENDIWRILNYLGIKCDTEHALKIIEGYKKGEDPLLVCILKHTPIYTEPAHIDEELSEDNSSSATATDENSHKSPRRCKHYASCRVCRSRIASMKDKYKMKKKRISQKEVLSHNILQDDNFSRKVRVIEEKLIEEMFEQLRDVYEGEMDMLREEQQDKVQRSLASHALLLQKHRDELEEELRERQLQMEAELQKRKEFVRGLAASLKEAHLRLRSEQRRLRGDADGLAERENNLKYQLQEAEESIRSKGEEMRKLITEELAVLDERLRTLRQEREEIEMTRERQEIEMRREREEIETRRAELESLRRTSDANIKLLNRYSTEEKENLVRQYDSMKHELALLRKYIETAHETKSKEKVTEEKMRNNEQVSEKIDDERLKRSQVVNDLKKLKNVNISQPNVTVSRKWSDTGTGECRTDGSCDELLRLREENQRIREFAHQQSSHIEMLTLGLRQFNQPGLLAPTLSETTFIRRMDDGQAREPQPAAPATAGADRDGAPRDPATSRRRFNQWKEIRRRVSHIDRRSQSQGADSGEDGYSSSNAGIPEEDPDGINIEQHQDRTETHKLKFLTEKYTSKTRDTPLLSESREKLRRKMKESLLARTKSPNKMLREAKLRLRKLEIEAEAVEKSYMNFRKRRADEKKLFFKDESHMRISDDYLETRKEALPKKYNDETKSANSWDYDKYLREYQKLHGSKLTYTNRNTAIERVKPIPQSYYEIDMKLKEEKSPGFNYLETPMLEFRKLYQSDKFRPIIKNNIQAKNIDEIEETKKSKIKTQVLKILQNDNKKTYNLNSQEVLNSGNNIVENFLNSNNIVELNSTSKDFQDDIETIKNTPEISEQGLETTATVALKCNDSKEDIILTPRNDVTDIPKIEVKDLQLVSETSEVPENPTSFIESKIVVESSEVNNKNSKEASLEDDIKQKRTIEETVSFNNADSNKNEPELVKEHDISVELHKEMSYDENNKDSTEAEYADDFSADLNNYNSPSEYGNYSGISVLIASEDDNFWES